jgi:carboxypeptidase Q
MRNKTVSSWLVCLGVSALTFTTAAVLGAPPPHGAAAGPSYLNRIADEGFNHSEIPATSEYLDDQIGGRMTNSPAMRRAEKWTQERFRAWGLANIHTEGFDFGRGWWIEASHIRQVTPRPIDLKGIPVAWSPPTSGVVTAPIIVAPVAAAKDLEPYKGKLAGKIVLTSWPAPQADDLNAPFHRYDGSEIQRMDRYREPTYEPGDLARRLERYRFATLLDEFLAKEGAVAQVTMSRSEGRLVHGEGRGYQVGHTPKVPAVELAAEDYRRLTRLAKVGEVTVELDNHVHYEDQDHNAYNVFAEIPGTDPAAGYVMAGAHLDSWVAGDGAADNGAGSVIIMEAARILAKTGVRPKRTIRFVLWAGEEQGLLGSAAYVEKHLATRPPATDPALKDLPAYLTQDSSYPVHTLPGFDELAAYFNIDNGSGKIRGIYTEGNLEVVSTLHEWLAPFGSLGVSSVVAEPTGGTDHVFLAALGLPAFQFIQDPLDYESRVHHTDLDTYDHLRIEDMKQAAVVLASVLYDAASAEKPLPHKPVPAQPAATDPFSYPDPRR